MYPSNGANKEQHVFLKKHHPTASTLTDFGIFLCVFHISLLPFTDCLYVWGPPNHKSKELWIIANLTCDHSFPSARVLESTYQFWSGDKWPSYESIKNELARLVGNEGRNQPLLAGILGTKQGPSFPTSRAS